MLKGVCCFHSETGTEGGYWAFQDNQFITENVLRPYCKKCGKYLGPQEHEKIKVTKVVPMTQEILDGEEPPDCPEGEHEQETGDSWSYEGLHILENGDSLTIYSLKNPKKIVWKGIISLQQQPLFTENASGYWIHADQKNIEREKWATYFFERYSAELIPVRKP